MSSETGFGSYIEEMKWRGFFAQCSDEPGLNAAMNTGLIAGYAGFDPTADTLHVGSLVPIMGLVHLQRHGHRPLAIVGGGTAMVGDPSGRTDLRRMLTPDRIAENLAGIRAQLERFIRFGDGATDARMFDNAEWLQEWKYIDFLREVGRHFSVNQMLARDSVKTRLEVGLSFIEFNYMILQAYDFMVLNRDHGCTLQVGGNDQWGNICSGIDLCRRVNRTEVFGLTFPLIETANGDKMGKTAAGAVWLDAERTRPYEFFQYWVNVDDRDLSRFLRLYTLMPRDRIEELEALTGADIREAKRVLAREVTGLVHGSDAAAAAERAAAALFGGGADESDVPASDRPAADFAADGVSLLDALVDTGLLKSKGEARRLIRQRAVRVAGEIVVDEMRQLTAADAESGRIVLQVGKKRFHHIRLRAES